MIAALRLKELPCWVILFDRYPWEDRKVIRDASNITE
jgi:hypothetical protein